MEKKDRNREIIELRKNGASVRDLEKIFQKSHGWGVRICKRLGVGSDVCQPPVFDPAEYVSEWLPEWEYVDGYSDSDGYFTIRNRLCGHLILINSRTVRAKRKRPLQCPECAKVAREEEEKRRQEEKASIRILNKLERLAKKEEQQRLREEEKKKPKGICEKCGSFLFGNQKKYCEECARNIKRNKKAGYKYQFPLKTIYERDKGVCWLCGGKCDWNDYTVKGGFVIYGNMYPSRDHVVPVVLGGKNSLDNIKLAHRICNTMKGAKAVSNG